MKKKRALPYGYTIQDGRRTIEEREAEVIRRIFAEYQSGSSMAELAATMTTLQIPYCEKRVDWNKNIIARILANPRYAGADGFDPIIDMDVFKEVNISKSDRTKRAIVEDNSAIGIIRARILCGKCGEQAAQDGRNLVEMGDRAHRRLGGKAEQFTAARRILQNEPHVIPRVVGVGEIPHFGVSGGEKHLAALYVIDVLTDLQPTAPTDHEMQGAGTLLVKCKGGTHRVEVVVPDGGDAERCGGVKQPVKIRGVKKFFHIYIT